MATTLATWIEDVNMQKLTNRLNAYLKVHPQVEIASVSHCILVNSFSAMVILKLKQTESGKSFSIEDLPELNEFKESA